MGHSPGHGKARRGNAPGPTATTRFPISPVFLRAFATLCGATPRQKALSFMNIDCKLCHGNLRVDTVLLCAPDSNTGTFVATCWQRFLVAS